MEHIGWATAIISAVCAVFGAVLVAVVNLYQVGKVMGKTETTLQAHEDRLKLGNGVMKGAAEKDEVIIKTITEIDSRCAARGDKWQRNDKEHDEFFGRLSKVEIELAGLPGRVANEMETKFNGWQDRLQKSIKGTVIEVFEERAKNQRGGDS